GLAERVLRDVLGVFLAAENAHGLVDQRGPVAFDDAPELLIGNAIRIAAQIGESLCDELGRLHTRSKVPHLYERPILENTPEMFQIFDGDKSTGFCTNRMRYFLAAVGSAPAPF